MPINFKKSDTHSRPITHECKELEAFKNIFSSTCLDRETLLVHGVHKMVPCDSGSNILHEKFLSKLKFLEKQCFESIQDKTK